MAMLDRLYRSSEKDLASGDAFVRRYFRQLTLAPAAAATVTLVDTDVCPADTVRLITNVGIRWSPGAAQFGLNANVLWSDGAGASFGAVVNLSPFNQGVAQTQDQYVGGLQILMMQGDVMTLSCFFNAGAAANGGSAFIHGLEFPRGTLRR
jgi:hypothetical protein